MEVNPGEISWTSQQNVLLLNPRLTPEARTWMTDLAVQAIDSQHLTSCLILASSGSNTAADRYVKLVVLAKSDFLANAVSVCDFLDLKPSDLWLRVLPLHHVGGLAILARAQISSCSVISENVWDINQIAKVLDEYPVTYMSVVPTQVYDLVKNGIKAPNSMKALLVGGGFLSPELKESAAELGWKVWLTYGMTETASMVSLSEDQILRSLKNVEMNVNINGVLGIRCPSLATGRIYRNSRDEVVFESIRDSDGWFWTEDMVEKERDGLILLGRSSDFVKIGGEGTHMQGLREIWEIVSRGQSSTAVWAVPSERLGHEIQLLVEDSFAGSEIEIEAMKAQFNRRVLPNQKIRSVQRISVLPRSDLGKILWKKLNNR
ncbi:MAG: AMP-binding protein [Bdellovibrionaceae bacterium]|nr:AMP-binding protein [Pseudobdellovibrionaceae bacterium]